VSQSRSGQLLVGLEPPIIQPLAQSYTTELSQMLRCLVVGFCKYDDEPLVSIEREHRLAGDKVYTFLG
jgi:hypothetical protein